MTDSRLVVDNANVEEKTDLLSDGVEQGLIAGSLSQQSYATSSVYLASKLHVKSTEAAVAPQTTGVSVNDADVDEERQGLALERMQRDHVRDSHTHTHTHTLSLSLSLSAELISSVIDLFYSLQMRLSSGQSDIKDAALKFRLHSLHAEVADLKTDHAADRARNASEYDALRQELQGQRAIIEQLSRRVLELVICSTFPCHQSLSLSLTLSLTHTFFARFRKRKRETFHWFVVVLD